jgi:hypothetical protein
MSGRRLSANMNPMLAQLTQRKTVRSAHDAAPFTIRSALPVDTPAIEALSELDSSRAPRGQVLLAEVGDELWAALSLEDGHGVGDPFRFSGEALWVLGERARQLHGAGRRRSHRFGPLRPVRA